MYKVYRYENPKDNKGPYTCTHKGIYYYICEEILEAHNDNSTRPSFFSDGFEFVVDNNIGYRAACESIESLKKWFESFNEELIECGFVIAEYIVSNVYHGRSGLQCVFHEVDVIERKVVSPLF